ncbi:ABC transporter permease [Streptomyces sp. NPDC050504]|uniref:ABC transporter permease n=1 Tax=Streptomyces sp. NPDC050504 TaxID=3365618 RepID=UPI0037AE34D9
MTAPLTPPHQPSNDDPWQAPPAGLGAYELGHQGWPGTKDGDERFDVKEELRDSLLVMLAVAFAGVVLGLLWLWLAPRVPLVSDDRAVFLKDTESEEAIGADGTFVLLGLAFGAVTAVAVFLFRRRGGVGVVAGLALGGLLGSLLAWWLGVSLGPTSDVVAHAREVGKGVVFDAPLELRARGAVLAWPVAAMVVHLGVTALFGPRDPEPVWVAPDPGPAPEAPKG